MTCPYCEKELKDEDVYGINLRLDSFNMIKPGFEKQGDIFKCLNEECESEAFNYLFHTDPTGELHDGYPC